MKFVKNGQKCKINFCDLWRMDKMQDYFFVICQGWTKRKIIFWDLWRIDKIQDYFLRFGKNGHNARLFLGFGKNGQNLRLILAIFLTSDDLHSDLNQTNSIECDFLLFLYSQSHIICIRKTLQC